METFCMKTRNLFALGAITIALLSGCGKTAEQIVEEQPVRPAKFYNVVDISSKYTQNFPAIIEASDESDLAFRVGGQIEQLPVVAGSRVKKGEILAVLDQTDYKLKVARAKASYELRMKTFERQEQMLALELTSQAEFDQALSTMTLAKVNYETAKNNLKYTTIRAPFDGIVSKLNFENHETINPKAPLLSFHAENGVDITFQLPESILGQKISPEAKLYQPAVSFTSKDGKAGRTFKANFQEIAHEADPKSRSFEVVLTMPKPEDVNVVPGMTANVQLELDKILEGLEQYALVPVEAVFSPETSDPSTKVFAVWVVDKNTMTVHQREVTIDEITDQGIRVTSGVNAGDTIIAAGVSSLLEGTEVREWIRERGI